MKITEPLIELLAIKLYEHDHAGGWPPKSPQPSWFSVSDNDRELYREIARGNRGIHSDADEAGGGD